MLRLWVDAGFDLKTLDADAIRQAVSSRNEALAIYLIDAGVPVNPRPPAAAGGDGASQDHADEPPLLAAAILRQDAIVDRLLARAQTRPAWPRTGRARVLADRARQSGRAGSSLRGGARLDDPRLPGAGALRPDQRRRRLRRHCAGAPRRAGHGQGLDRACLPDGGEFRLLDGPGYFAGLQQLGFNGGSADRGAPLGRRVLAALLQGRELIVARRDTAVDVLRRLKAGGTDLQAPQEDGETPLNAAIRLGRKDLADALLAAGADPDAPDLQGRSPAWTALETGQPRCWPCWPRTRRASRKSPRRRARTSRRSCCARPRPRSTKRWPRRACRCSRHVRRRLAPHGRGVSKAVSKSAAPQRLPGHYYLQGVREVGSELVLSEDGSFDYLMSYGAVDISASGAWRSDGKQVTWTRRCSRSRRWRACARRRAGPAGKSDRARVLPGQAGQGGCGHVLGQRRLCRRAARVRRRGRRQRACCLRWRAARAGRVRAVALGRALAFRRRVEAGSGCSRHPHRPGLAASRVDLAAAYFNDVARRWLAGGNTRGRALRYAKE